MPTLRQQLLLVLLLTVGGCSLGYDELATGQVGGGADLDGDDANGTWHPGADDVEDDATGTWRDGGVDASSPHKDAATAADSSEDDLGQPLTDADSLDAPTSDDVQPPDDPSVDAPVMDEPPPDLCAARVVPEVGAWSGSWSGNVNGAISGIGGISFYTAGTQSFTVSCNGGQYAVDGMLRDGAQTFNGTFAGSFDPATRTMNATMSIEVNISGYRFTLPGTLSGSLVETTGSGPWSVSAQGEPHTEGTGNWTATRP